MSKLAVMTRFLFFVGVLVLNVAKPGVLDLEKVDALHASIKEVQKVELHLHLGGAWPIDFLKTIAEPADFLELTKFLEQINQGLDYHAAFRVFGLVSKIVNSDQRVEDGTAALCASLAEDGVTYVEIRTGLKDLGSGLEGYLSAVLRGVQKGCANNSLKVGIVLSLKRDSNSALAEHTLELIKKYREKGVVGLDISGDSTCGDGREIFHIFAQIHQEEIPVALHLGESSKETPDQQMKELQIINPKRVGHCVFLCPEALRWIQDRKIPVELCLTSAVKVGMIENHDKHPALRLLTDGHPVVICTDDPLIFATTLSKECAMVAYLLGYSPLQIAALQTATLGYRLDMIRTEEGQKNEEASLYRTN